MLSGIVEPEYTAEQIAAMSHEVCGMLSTYFLS
jgi:hypothetical protein